MDKAKILAAARLGSLATWGRTFIRSAPNNIALKSVSIMSWFRLTQDEKQKDFELALNLAKNHPELFEVAHEYEFAVFTKEFRTSIRKAGIEGRPPGKA